MREIKAEEVTKAVKQLCLEAGYQLNDEMREGLKRGLEKEKSPVGRDILQQLLANADIAAEGKVPMCQDTGTAVIFVDVGQDLHITGGDLTQALNEGVRQGYTEGYLRKSIAAHPLKRTNTGDNTPAVIHYDIVPGDKLEIHLDAKGGGSENMAGLAMLPPSAGVEGVKNFVVERVRQAGANPCPPIVVGVGLGGNFEKVAYLAKKSLLRPLGSHNPDPDVAALEDELLELVNKTGVGPQGMGGTFTAFAVHIETYACHITGLPVAVNLDCHAHRHKHAVL